MYEIWLDVFNIIAKYLCQELVIQPVGTNDVCKVSLKLDHYLAVVRGNP